MLKILRWTPTKDPRDRHDLPIGWAPQLWWEEKINDLIVGWDKEGMELLQVSPIAETGSFILVFRIVPRGTSEGGDTSTVEKP